MFQWPPIFPGHECYVEVHQLINCVVHYLLQVSTVLRNEPPHVRYSALCLLRDLMAKHDLDTRYSKAVSTKALCQAHVVALVVNP